MLGVKIFSEINQKQSLISCHRNLCRYDLQCIPIFFDSRKIYYSPESLCLFRLSHILLQIAIDKHRKCRITKHKIKILLILTIYNILI